MRSSCEDLFSFGELDSIITKLHFVTQLNFVAGLMIAEKFDLSIFRICYLEHTAQVSMEDLQIDLDKVLAS